MHTNDSRPNLLLIMVDQLRYDCLGFHGKYPISTPNLDKIAREGMNFPKAFTTIPTSCPARQSFMTGMRAEQIGALWNYDITLPVSSMTPDMDTWSRQVSVEGYRCGYIGKWHCSPTYDPTSFGFENYFSEHDYESYLSNNHIDASTLKTDWRGGVSDIPLEHSRTHVFAKKAIEWIERCHDSQDPWVTCLEFPEPHLPCTPTTEFAELYGPEATIPWEGFYDTLEGKPSMQRKQQDNWDVVGMEWEDWAPVVAKYYGIISQLDDAIGKVLQYLSDIGEEENTLVIFTSDHGDLCGSRGLPDKHYVMYDDVMRVPLLMKFPGRIPAGKQVDHLLSHTLDVPLTMMELLGINWQPTGTGRSFISWFDGAQAPIRNQIMGTYHGAQFGLYCERLIRTDRYAYVWNPTSTDELYDLETDPGALNNLIDSEDFDDVKKELKTLLYDELTAEHDPVLREQWIAHQLTGERNTIIINPTY